jgi:hypothetical protein
MLAPGINIHTVILTGLLKQLLALELILLASGIVTCCVVGPGILESTLDLSSPYRDLKSILSVIPTGLQKLILDVEVSMLVPRIVRLN